MHLRRISTNSLGRKDRLIITALKPAVRMVFMYKIRMCGVPDILYQGVIM